METKTPCPPAGTFKPVPTPAPPPSGAVYEGEDEDDVAEMVCHLANGVAQDSVLQNWQMRPDDALKQQFRDALNKLIDERIRIALGR